MNQALFLFMRVALGRDPTRSPNKIVYFILCESDFLNIFFFFVSTFPDKMCSAAFLSVTFTVKPLFTKVLNDE